MANLHACSLNFNCLNACCFYTCRGAFFGVQFVLERCIFREVRFVQRCVFYRGALILYRGAFFRERFSANSTHASRGLVIIILILQSCCSRVCSILYRIAGNFVYNGGNFLLKEHHTKISLHHNVNVFYITIMLSCTNINGVVYTKICTTDRYIYNTCIREITLADETVQHYNCCDHELLFKKNSRDSS